MYDNATIPLNDWKSILRLDDNKEVLYHYLAVSTQSLSIPDIQGLSTVDVFVISSTMIDNEACIFIHAIHACVSGMKKILIRTVIRDVVVLAIAFQHKWETE